MKPVLRDMLHLVEGVVLGFWIAVMPVVLAGGIYEVVTGGPSDGFLFGLMFFAFAWFAAVLAVVPVACCKAARFRVLCRWISLIMLAGLMWIWSQNRG